VNSINLKNSKLNINQEERIPSPIRTKMTEREKIHTTLQVIKSLPKFNSRKREELPKNIKEYSEKLICTRPKEITILDKLKKIDFLTKLEENKSIVLSKLKKGDLSLNPDVKESLNKSLM